MSEAATLVTVLRHGEVAGPANVLRGRMDTPLSDTGWRQMRTTYSALDTPVTMLATSPLLRCSAFAREIAVRHNLPLHENDALREIDFGAWENLTPDAARASSPTLFAKFLTHPEGVTLPQGEPFDAFKQRVLTAFDTCLAQSNGGHLLMITHAGVMRVLLASIMNMPWADVYRVAIPAAGSFRLSCLAEHPPYLLNLNPSCVA